MPSMKLLQGCGKLSGPLTETITGTWEVATWGTAGVRLNGVAPDNTNTPMLHKVTEDPTTREGIRSVEIPLGGLAEPDDIASVVMFLCSPEASYVRGSIFYVDSGIDLQSRPDPPSHASSPPEQGRTPGAQGAFVRWAWDSKRPTG